MFRIYSYLTFLITTLVLVQAQYGAFVGCIATLTFDNTIASTVTNAQGSISSRQDCEYYCYTKSPQPLFAYWKAYTGLCSCSNTGVSSIALKPGTTTSGYCGLAIDDLTVSVDVTASSPSNYRPFTTCHVVPQNAWTYDQIVPVPSSEICFIVCPLAIFPYLVITPNPSNGNYLCNCASTLPPTLRTTCGPFVNLYYSGDAEFNPASPVLRRRERELRTRRDKGLCPKGMEACAVPGARGAYECIDTQSELESCGGCLNGPYSEFNSTTPGVDCQSIPGVALGGVTCSEGRCKVYECQARYDLVDGRCQEN